MPERTIRASKLDVASERLLEPSADEWSRCERHRIDLVPAPLPLLQQVSPYLTTQQGHGKITRLDARLAHDGTTLSIRLSWRDPSREDRITDLDRFVDAGAIMFPLAEGANPVTMGDPERPVNAWLWRADRDEPFDVIARGYSTSQRRDAADSGLRARSLYREEHWQLVLQRPLAPPQSGYARFGPDDPSGIAFALWEGGNAERSAQKAISGAAFFALELAG